MIHQYSTHYSNHITKIETFEEYNLKLYWLSYDRFYSTIDGMVHREKFTSASIFSDSTICFVIFTIQLL
jgi:hypothetical protein